MIPKTYSEAQAELEKRRIRKAKRAAKGLRRPKVKKVPKAKLRKKLVKALDTEFSLAVRERDSKVRGGLCVFDWCNNAIACCFHFVTRAKHSVRWDFTNAVGSCIVDNYKMEFNPHPYISWYIKQNGIESYESLVTRSNRIAKFSIEELEQIRESIRASREPSAAVHSEGVSGA